MGNGRVQGEAAAGPLCALGRRAWPGLMVELRQLSVMRTADHVTEFRANLCRWWRAPPRKGSEPGLPPRQHGQGPGGAGAQLI